MLAGLVVLAAVVSPTVRGALVGLVVAVFGLVLLVALVAALTVGLLGRIVSRHPLADLAAGYLIGCLSCAAARRAVRARSPAAELLLLPAARFPAAEFLVLPAAATELGASDAAGWDILGAASRTCARQPMRCARAPC
jgi:uncharacterized transporter YbjL